MRPGPACVRRKRAGARLLHSSVGLASCVVSASVWSQVFDSAGQGLARMRDGLSTESRPPRPLGFAAACAGFQVRTHAEAGHARQAGVGQRDEAVRPGAQLPCPHGRSAQASRRTCADAARHIEVLRARSDATLPELEALRRDHVAGEGGSRLDRMGLSRPRPKQLSDRECHGWRPAGLQIQRGAHDAAGTDTNADVRHPGTAGGTCARRAR